MILTSGCFDGIHSGHVRYLTAAAGLDETMSVFVALASDDYIRLIKRRTPRWHFQDRRETLEALTVVTWVVRHDETGAAAAIRTLQPRYFVKGIDWQHKLPDDILAACHDVGCEIAFVDTEATHSSEAYAVPPFLAN